MPRCVQQGASGLGKGETQPNKQQSRLAGLLLGAEPRIGGCRESVVWRPRRLHTSARLRSVPFSRRPAPCDGGDPAYTARGDAQGQVCRSGQGVARSAALGDLSSPAASRVEGRTRPAAPAFAADFPSRTQPRQPWRKWPLRRYASRHKCIPACGAAAVPLTGGAPRLPRGRCERRQRGALRESAGCTALACPPSPRLDASIAAALRAHNIPRPWSPELHRQSASARNATRLADRCVA